MNEASSPSFSKDYAAVREGGAGLIDLSSRGRIAVAGVEAAKFLNGLVTNDVKALAPHFWIPAIFPNVQGRVLASVRIMNLGDQFLIDTEMATYEIVLNLLSRFTLAGDFRVTDQTEEIAATIGRIPGLDVKAPRSSFSLKDKNLGIREMGKALGQNRARNTGSLSYSSRPIPGYCEPWPVNRKATVGLA